jgi:hypothetical protein
MKDPMKSGKLSTSLLLGVVLLASTAFAAEKTNLQTTKAMTVNGNSLPAGKYTVTWDGSGPSVELKFLKGKYVVATVPGQVVSLKATTSPGSIVTKTDAGSLSLTEIRPDGKNYALTIGGEVVQTAAENNTK